MREKSIANVILCGWIFLFKLSLIPKLSTPIHSIYNDNVCRTTLSFIRIMYVDQLDFWTCFLHNLESLTCSLLHENVLRNQNSFLCNMKEIWVLLKSSLLGNNFIFCWCCFLFLYRNTEIWKTINIGYPILCGKVLAGLANWFLGPYLCCTPTTQTQNTQSGGHNCAGRVMNNVITYNHLCMKSCTQEKCVNMLQSAELRRETLHGKCRPDGWWSIAKSPQRIFWLPDPDMALRALYCWSL